MHAQNQKSQALALFDFDGTLYPRDSFTGFIFYVLKKRHIIKRGIKILPWIIAYYLRLYPAHKMRPKLYSTMFKGCQIQEIQSLAGQYSRILLEQLDPALLSQLSRHQQLGHRVILVSATIDLYLQHIATSLGIELLCTPVEIQSGQLTGKYLSADCSCIQKKLRVLNVLNPVNYDTIYAYGNSAEDLDMLSLAQQPYMVGRDQSLPELSIGH